MIFEEIKKSFVQVNSNPAITTFLVSFLILIVLFASYAFSLQQKILGLILLLCIFFLTCLFFGGWFQMFDEVQKEDKKPLVGVFFEGAGKNIIPSTVTFLIFILLTVLTSFVAAKISMKFFGDPSFLMNDLATVAQDKSAYIEYVNNIPKDKLEIIYGWPATFILIYFIFYFLFLFLPPVFIKSENKFTALIKNLEFTFKNFGFSLYLYIIICAGFLIMHFLKLLASIHPILSLVYLFINIYFISYVVMLIFNCYERKNSCTDGCDSIGEDQDSNSTGKEE